MAVSCQCSPQKLTIAIEKFFLFQVLMNIQKDWKAKLKSAYSFILKYSKITVCIPSGGEQIISTYYYQHFIASFKANVKEKSEFQLFAQLPNFDTAFRRVRTNSIFYGFAKIKMAPRGAQLVDNRPVYFDFCEPGTSAESTLQNDCYKMAIWL